MCSHTSLLSCWFLLLHSGLEINNFLTHFLVDNEVIFFSRFKSFDTVVFGDNEVSIGNLICFPNTNPYGEYCENCVAGDIRNVILLTASSFGQLGWTLAYILKDWVMVEFNRSTVLFVWGRYELVWWRVMSKNAHVAATNFYRELYPLSETWVLYMYSNDQ